MSIVNVLNISVLDNPAKFGDSYTFDITFECLEQLSKDLEWKLTYVGSPDSTKHDQVLDSIMVGPIPVGVNRFQFTADPPQADSIPPSDILGVTVILLTCAYDDKEFIRVGYYQNNEYPEGSEERRLWEEKLEKKEKITSVDVSKVVRNILADKPKVTRFNIRWDNPDGEDVEYPPPQPLDGEIEREMQTEEGALDVASDSALDNHKIKEISGHPASEPIGETIDDAEDVEDLGSEDEEDEEEEDEGDISLDEEDLEEEDLEGDEDEEMQDADGADEDITMQNVENNAHTGQHAVTQGS